MPSETHKIRATHFVPSRSGKYVDIVWAESLQAKKKVFEQNQTWSIYKCQKDSIIVEIGWNLKKKYSLKSPSFGKSQQQINGQTIVEKFKFSQNKINFQTHRRKIRSDRDSKPTPYLQNARAFNLLNKCDGSHRYSCCITKQEKNRTVLKSFTGKKSNSRSQVITHKPKEHKRTSFENKSTLKLLEKSKSK